MRTGRKRGEHFFQRVYKKSSSLNVNRSSVGVFSLLALPHEKSKNVEMQSDQAILTDREYTESLIRLGDLVMKFGQVDRVTMLPDGVTPESDTDHTVMLGITACAFAAALMPQLDLGKVAQYSLVHDFVEVYAGDTPSLGISLTDKGEKDRREHQAFLRIEREYSRSYPWLPETIKAYELLADREARFVKTMDKAMPKITHLLNKGAYFKRTGMTKAALAKLFDQQHKELSDGYGKDLDQLLSVLRLLMDRMLEEPFG